MQLSNTIRQTGMQTLNEHCKETILIEESWTKTGAICLHTLRLLLPVVAVV